MGTEGTRSSTPDLFSTDTEREASAQTKLRAANSTTHSAARRILPKDLPSAVKHLSDGELDLMYAATLEEMKRRGKLPTGVETDLQTLRPRFDVHTDFRKKSPPSEKRHAVETETPLTVGQVNAVRAAFKAGITPSRIARQFGLPQSSVRKALKT